MSDGRLWFITKIDNSQAVKDLKRLENKIRNSQETIAKMEMDKMPFLTQMEAANKQLEKAKQRLSAWKDTHKHVQNVIAEGVMNEDYLQAIQDLPEIEKKIKDQEKLVAAARKEWQKAKEKVAYYDREILKANNDIARNQEKSEEASKKLNSVTAKTQEALEHTADSAEKFRKRIFQVGTSMVLFRVFSAALQGASEHMNKLLQTNTEYTAQLARLKGALMTAFQPIYEFALPGVIALLKVLTNVVSVIGNVASFWLGRKTEQQSARNAKALNSQVSATEALGEAAEEARRSLAGFDEINQLQSTQEGSAAMDAVAAEGIDPDFSDFDTAAYKAKIDELTAYLSGALLALGAILAFSGANIPLGIGLMAVGALGLATVAEENWGAMSTQLENAIGAVSVGVSSVLLVLGMILAFSGANVPLGIGLIGVGAAGLVATASLSWDSMTGQMQAVTSSILALGGSVLLSIGLLLAFSGINPALGIALILAGAAGLATAAVLNWDWVKQPFTEIGDWLRDWASSLFENMWESATNWFQSIADEWNSIWGSISSYQTSGIIPDMSYNLSTYEIPALARGAVIPPNREFLAVLGDQRSGTNIEAPLETIKQALAEVMSQYGGRGDININFTGDLAQLARILKPEIDREDRRIGGSLISGGDIF